jgi:hypothetical protein
MRFGVADQAKNYLARGGKGLHPATAFLRAEVNFVLTKFESAPAWKDQLHEIPLRNSVLRLRLKKEVDRIFLMLKNCLTSFRYCILRRGQAPSLIGLRYRFQS